MEAVANAGVSCQIPGCLQREVDPCCILDPVLCVFQQPHDLLVNHWGQLRAVSCCPGDALIVSLSRHDPQILIEIIDIRRRLVKPLVPLLSSILESL